MCGLKQVVISNNCVDIWNSKTIRATMGAIFRLDIIKSSNIVETLKELKKQKYKIMATSLEQSKNIYEIKYKKTAIIVGNEANGVSKELLNLADVKIKIPMIGKTESLNVAVATSVILYEYVRQNIENKK